MTLPLPQTGAQGMGGYNPYAAQGQMHAQAPQANGYNPYAAPGQMQAQAPAMNGYNPYGNGNPGVGGYNPYGMQAPNGYNPYGGTNPYQAAPTLPASGGANNYAPTIRTDR